MHWLLKNRVTRNAAWIIGCKAAQAILGLLISLLVARYLGPSRYGLLNYAASIVMFLTPVAQLGFTYTLVQELVNHPEDEGKILGSSAAASMASSIFCIAGIALFVRATFPDETITLMVCVLYSLLLLAQSVELIQYWFQAKLLSKYSAVITLIAYTLICLYQFFLVKAQKDLLWFSVAKSLEYILITAGLWVVYRKLGGKKLSFSMSCVKRMFSQSWYYMLSTLLVMTFAQADRIMIRMIMDDTAMGYYSAAVVCANLSEFVFIAIIDSFRPTILEGKKRGDATYETGVSALYSTVIYLSLAQSIVITLLARPIVLLLYGGDYAPAAAALRIIVWYTAFSYIGIVRNIWMLAEEKQKYLWIINSCGAALNVGLNAVMIPRYGIEGAAFTSLLTQIVTNVVIGFVLPPIRGNNRLLAKGLDPRSAVAFLKQLSQS